MKTILSSVFTCLLLCLALSTTLLAQRTVEGEDKTDFKFIDPNEHSQATLNCKPPNLTQSLCNDFHIGPEKIIWDTNLEVNNYTITVIYQGVQESITLDRKYVTYSEITTLIPLPDEYNPDDRYYLNIRSNSTTCIEDNNIFEDERILHLTYQPCVASRTDDPGPGGAKGFATLDTPGKNGKLKQLPTSALVIVPNPIQDRMQINLDLPKTDQVSLTLYNTNGQAVKQLLTTQLLQRGTHYFDWDISDLPASIYYCNIQTGGLTLSKKVIKMD